jgi:hypothetical protein
MVINTNTFTITNPKLSYAFTESNATDPILKYAYTKNLSYNDTSVIYNLEPKTYTYISDPDAGTQIGYIAEDTIKVHPNLTTYNEYTHPLTPVAINYDVITVFLVEEVKKLKQQIEVLTNLNVSLSTRITSLENP